MKKMTALLLALLMLAGVLAGCGKQTDADTTDKLKIVTTISLNTTGSKNSSVTRLITPK